MGKFVSFAVVIARYYRSIFKVMFQSHEESVNFHTACPEDQIEKVCVTRQKSAERQLIMLEQHKRHRALILG
jgi:hypothetical protein